MKTLIPWLNHWCGFKRDQIAESILHTLAREPWIRHITLDHPGLSRPGDN